MQVCSFETLRRWPKNFYYVWIRHNLCRKVCLGVESFDIQLPNSLKVFFSFIFVGNMIPWGKLKVYLFCFSLHLSHHVSRTFSATNQLLKLKNSPSSMLDHIDPKTTFDLNFQWLQWIQICKVFEVGIWNPHVPAMFKHFKEWCSKFMRHPHAYINFPSIILEHLTLSAKPFSKFIIRHLKASWPYSRFAT
jgi:hypothetical protein